MYRNDKEQEFQSIEFLITSQTDKMSGGTDDRLQQIIVSAIRPYAGKWRVVSYSLRPEAKHQRGIAQ